MKASRISEHVVTIIKGLFDGGRPAEQNYRSCDGFLKLSRITDPAIFEAACKYAMEDRCYSYKNLINTNSDYSDDTDHHSDDIDHLISDRTPESFFSTFSCQTA